MIRTEQDVAKAATLIASLKTWRAELAKAETIRAVRYYGEPNSGWTGNGSAETVAAVKRVRIAECQAAIAQLRRQAAQLSLTLSE